MKSNVTAQFPLVGASDEATQNENFHVLCMTALLFIIRSQAFNSQCRELI